MGDVLATWWGRWHQPVAGGYVPFGDSGRTMQTRLSEHADASVDAGIDPVTGASLNISPLGALQWLKAWYDYQCNAETAPPPPEPDPQPDPEPESSGD
ncbi:hypothetical protein [Coralloluteibacterium thermophilus]|uniref:hypothetical protein n=1 Tax=Coralloluteibacterium thermophilum TaxID=2707049 RepID=UPI00367214A7